MLFTYTRLADPEYTIYYSFVNPQYDHGMSNIPLRQRPTACIVDCLDEKDMREKYNYLLVAHKADLHKMEIKVYKER